MRRYFLLAFVWGFCFLLGGCGEYGETASGANPLMEAIDAWPQNEYTQSVPAPEDGAAQYQILDGQTGYYAIFYRDITREEGEAYLDALQAAGFAAQAGTDEPAASGALLQKDGLQLSISISEGTLGIYIYREDAAQLQGEG